MYNPRRARAVLLLLVLVSFTLIALDVYGGAPFSGLRGAAGTVVGPVQRGVSSVASPVRNFFGGVADLGKNGADVRRLQRANDQLRSELDSNRLDKARYAELQRLQLLAGLGQYDMVPAQVIGYGGSLGFELTLTLDVGSRDGVAVNQTVAAATGLVGRVVSVDAFTSQVLLITDPTSGVGTRVEGTNVTGTVDGAGTGPLKLTLLNAQTSVKVGDRLVSGPSKVSSFAPGVPVGVVSKLLSTPGSLTRSAEVEPFVDYTALDLVGVIITQPRTDPRDTVLKVVPAPTPSAATKASPQASTPAQPGGTPSPTATR